MKKKKTFISFFEWCEKNRITVNGTIPNDPAEIQWYEEVEEKYNEAKEEFEEEYYLISGRCGNCFITLAGNQIVDASGKILRCKCGGEFEPYYSQNKNKKINKTFCGHEIEQPKFLRDILGKNIEN